MRAEHKGIRRRRVREEAVSTRAGHIGIEARGETAAVSFSRRPERNWPRQTTKFTRCGFSLSSRSCRRQVAGTASPVGPYAFRQYSNRQIAAMLAVSERTVRPDRSSRLVQQRP
jgi:hypothetical protein